MTSLTSVVVMVLSGVLMLFTSLPYAKVNENAKSEYIINFRKEIVDSLRRNIHRCPYSELTRSTGLKSTGNGTADAKDGFQALFLYADAAEIHSFRELPPTLSAANRNAFNVGSKRGYNFKEWGNEREDRWEIPLRHPGHPFLLYSKRCYN